MTSTAQWSALIAGAVTYVTLGVLVAVAWYAETGRAYRRASRAAWVAAMLAVVAAPVDYAAWNVAMACGDILAAVVTIASAVALGKVANKYTKETL